MFLLGRNASFLNPVPHQHVPVPPVGVATPGRVCATHSFGSNIWQYL